MEVLLFGLSYYFAAVATATQASSTTMVVAATIVVYGLSFFFSSAAADAVAMADASNLNPHKNGDGYPSPLFFLFDTFVVLFLSFHSISLRYFSNPHSFGKRFFLIHSSSISKKLFPSIIILPMLFSFILFNII
jgi:hypothetical protein